MKIVPKVSVIVLNYNGLDDTIQCLESLKNITYQNCDVIVVDNNSDSNDVDILQEKYGNLIHLIRNPTNYGYAEGNNIGIRFAQRSNPSYILILNNDVKVAPRFLDELVKVAESDQRVGIAGPKQYYMDKPSILFSAGSKISPFFGLIQQVGQGKQGKHKYNQLREVDIANGACMLIKIEVINRVGFLPTDYFLQWEDADYSTKARLYGYKCLYVPQSIIWHKVSASTLHPNRKYSTVYRGFRNRIRYFNKYMPSFKFTAFIIWQVFVLLPLFATYYIICQRDVKKIYYMVKGIKKGIVEVLCRCNKDF